MRSLHLRLIYLHTIVHMPSTHTSFFIAIKTRAESIYHAAAILFLAVYRKKSQQTCITCIRDYMFALKNRFIDHSHVVTTNNYYSTADFHAPNHSTLSLLSLLSLVVAW
jgi:hypothetical protein